MKAYLVPETIAEALGLTSIRMKTPDGKYLLSEQDLVAYGIPKAINEGAIELSNSGRQRSQESEERTTVETPTSEGHQETENVTVTGEENEEEENLTVKEEEE